MDFSLYKNRLSDYLRVIGMPRAENKNIECVLPGHSGENRKDTAKIYDDNYTCFHCGFQGDVYDLVGIIKGIAGRSEQFKEVERTFGAGNIIPAKEKKPVRKRDKKAEQEMTDYMRILRNSHMDEINAFAEHRKYGEEFSRLFGYWPGYNKAKEDKGSGVIYDAMIPYKAWMKPGCVLKLRDGWKLFYVEDKKTVKMASLGSKTFPFPTFEQEAKRIVLVEAEISALACINHGIPSLATGGVNGISKSSVKDLEQYEEIIICLDGDKAGKSQEEKMAEKLLDGGYDGIIRIAALAVSEWGKDPDDYIKSDHTDELKYLIEKSNIYIPPTPEQKFEDKESKDEIPFKLLGFSEHCHYFLDRKDMITKIPAGKITSGQLLEVAPLDFWKSIKTNKQDAPDWTYIFDMMIDFSVKTGPYLKTSIRGAGVWEDNGEIIASDGEKIIHSGGRTPVKDYVSKNTYIRRAPIGIDSVENPDHDKDFDMIKYMTDVLSFLSPQDGKLLFGWIISSIFLSTITWRPIVYMKGPTQVGKSWVMNNIVRGILDGIAICPKKNSTVIGVMQAPGYDSRMTTVDELENGHDKKTQELVRGLMTLARDTTTKSKESRYIGTADQEGMNHEFSSIFLFASIVESSEDDQDVNRITPIIFSKKLQEKWAETEANILYEFNTGIGDRIRHNAIFHRESIVRNIYLFQKVAGAKADMQRNGDNLGTLIAGWYHLEYPGKIATEEEAAEYINIFDFSDQNDRGSGEMLKYIMSPILSAKIRYEEEEVIPLGNGDYDTRIKNRERTVYDILQHLTNETDVNARHPLNKALMGYGLRYGTKKNPNMLAVAQGHDAVKKMFPQDFSYRNNFADYLKNHTDFVEKEKSVKFLGTVHMALLFDVDLNDDETEEIYTAPEVKVEVETDLFNEPPDQGAVPPPIF